MAAAGETGQGPDFAQGVSLEDVPASGVLAGHVDGSPVLLARVDGQLYAVDGACTHYGAPLGAGLAVDGQIRCPWHHACFSLRTGQALRAPAFAGLATWTVETVGQRVFVRARVAGGAIAPQPGASAGSASRQQAPRRIVIIGGGAAGYAAALRLRESGFSGSLTLLSADSDAPYDRPNLSKDYLAGTAAEDWIPLQAATFYAEHDIDLRLRCEVAAIDVGAAQVTTLAGERFGYDRLLLATGAEPVRLPVPGFERSNVFTLRSLADARAVIAASAGVRTAVLIGAGFIGLEVAAALRTRGLEVHVVAREAEPMATVLGPVLAAELVQLHRGHGVVFHLQTSPTLFDGSRVLLEDGTPVDAGLVIVGVGVAPRTALAAAAGLAVDHGIVVDEQLQTSAPGIYAAGDVARYRQDGALRRVEHWVHAQRQGQAAAANLLGAAQAFTDVPFFWTHHYGLDLRYSGYGAGWDQVQLEGSLPRGDCLARFSRQGQLVAVASVGRDRDNLLAEAQLWH
ncbi:FAD-dependent oxidoreductase [Stenotrophomonas sp. YIM B06876]|uniref:FAD-dependent oxidoreductase n=1 Tax=Stenotrophomonas sp. YIM B06876 TaxID=3060211 RepID=UPI0027398E76|nr:FAD-dependent oxidoreductase [Stenotrophomonas sp. YIM B06876]